MMKAVFKQNRTHKITICARKHRIYLLPMHDVDTIKEGVEWVQNHCKKGPRPKHKSYFALVELLGDVEYTPIEES